LVFLLALFLISFHYTEVPGVWIDEGVFTEVAKNLAWHGQQGIQVAPGQIMSSSVVSTSGYPLVFAVAASFKIFGTGLWQARLPQIIYMFLLVLLFFLFSKKRWGLGAALFSILLLISFSPFYGNGRPVQGEVPGLAFIMAGALTALFWEEKKFLSSKYALLTGIFWGLAAATKPLYLVVLLPALVISLFFYRKKINLKELLFFSSGFLLPVIAWVFIQFPDRDLIKLALRAYLSGNSVLNFDVFNSIKSNFISFFTETTPFLFMMLLIFTSSVLGYFSFYRKKIVISFAELVIFLFIVLNWLAYLKGPGWYRHFFPADILLYLLFSGAIFYLKNMIPSFYQKSLLVILAGLVLLQFVYLFFFSQNFILTRNFGNKELELALSQVNPSQTILFYDTIETAIFLKHSNYYQYLKPADYLEFGNPNPADVASDYILIKGSDIKENKFSFPCYDEIFFANRYHLFKRQADCKNTGL
jgi:4-amino-4-deoxy-L-arabinose transferase-like glycosyltransferase